APPPGAGCGAWRTCWRPRPLSHRPGEAATAQRPRERPVVQVSDESGSGDAKGHEMSSVPPIDRQAAEQILRSDPAAWRVAGPVGAVLAAATATAGPDELAGEAAAVAAFRATAHLVPATSVGSQSMLKTALAKIVTVKVAG